PFMHWVTLVMKNGVRVRLFALWDSGAGLGVLSKEMFLRVQGRLGTTSPGTKRLKMANGVLVWSLAHWSGTIEVEGVQIEGCFEVFDSRGSWDMLLGKPLQEKLGVIHDMKRDVVTLEANGKTATIFN
ncbi:hypothetical protein C8R46DRAFT_839074, partial [Mycena filopes]